MTTTFKVKELPSFPTAWTAPSSCFATTNYYRVLLGSGYFSNMYGTPTPVGTGIWPTGDCWPPSSTPRIPYVTDGGCPTGFTRACATAGPDYKGKPMSTVTCCPSVTDNVFSFMCRDNQYGCHATATSGVVWTGVITDIGLATPTEEPVTRTPSLQEGIEAWGIKLISVAPDSTSATTKPHPTNPSKTANPTQSTSPDSGGLGTGGIVGVAIGTVAAVAILAFLGFFLYSRRKKANPNSSGSTWDQNSNHPSGGGPQYQYLPTGPTGNGGPGSHNGNSAVDGQHTPYSQSHYAPSHQHQPSSVTGYYHPQQQQHDGQTLSSAGHTLPTSHSPGNNGATAPYAVPPENKYVYQLDTNPNAQMLYSPEMDPHHDREYSQLAVPGAPPQGGTGTTGTTGGGNLRPMSEMQA
ncbi:hypothetical protein B0J18DRAFT_462212 [Chaetomium sp. MPI-SDFR-AT-0129]|nr:hypothetical protein B0J18DRAFT_462212 [Chaetomium sp. MPI-SDFR-AT-0129]